MNVPKLRFKADDGNEFPEWTKVSFGSLICEYVDKTKEENEDVLLSCAIEGVFLNSELFGHQRGESNVGYKKIQNNTLILSTQNLHLGNANVNRRFIHGIISPAYKTYHVVGCLPEFMAIWVKRPAAKRFFYEATTVGASQCRRNVVWDELYAQTLLLPSLLEQQKIVSFLSTIDEIITITEAELNVWQSRKRGLCQQLFSQKLRFKDDNEQDFPEWEEKKFGDIWKRIVVKNDGSFGGDKIISVANMKWAPKDDVRDDYLKTYNLLPSNAIAFEGNRNNSYSYGRFVLNDIGDGIVSHVFVCFEPIADIIPAFWKEYIHAECVMGKILRKCTKSSTMMHDLVVSDFLKQIIFVPSLPEQKKIAECLSSVDGVIRNIQAELSAWKEFKKGLLQQMFV